MTLGIVGKRNYMDTGLNKNKEYEEDRLNEKRVCPICKQKFYRYSMTFSYDKFGIPVRLLCTQCWKNVILEHGYDTLVH